VATNQALVLRALVEGLELGQELDAVPAPRPVPVMDFLSELRYNFVLEFAFKKKQKQKT
jgi:hypothetical protein